MNNGNDTRHDIIICGGGLAGLTLALQLKQQLPELDVAVVDQLQRPLPEAAFKVGESTVEVGTHYLAGVLGLDDYLERQHLRKMGLRFFFGNGNESFHLRPEYGLSTPPRIKSYQLDRGMLENHLRDLVEERGATLYEGVPVRAIELADGEGQHLVHIGGRGQGPEQTLSGRWVVDAMGRRRYLQKQLGLLREHGEKCSAAWFRIDGEIDVTDLVPPEQTEWHQRIRSGRRYYSTNHLMGDGRWVWLIPLGSGATSIGIVALESAHPFHEFNTYEAALCWLQEHEPALARAIGDREPLDFRCMRRYSYASHQVFSTDRWASIGEAGFFSDPFYSPATDLIGFQNCAITEMLKLEREGQPIAEAVDYFNNFLLGVNHWLTENIQIGYPYFGHPVVMACKVLWDTAGGWSMPGPQMFNATFLPGKTQQEMRRISGGFFFLTRSMQHLFLDWAQKSPRRISYDFLDYLSLPVMRELQLRNLRPGKSSEQLIADQARNIKRLEEMALAFFFLAVEDVMPERLDELLAHDWLNAWAVTLDADKWEKNGLFRPRTEPGEMSATYQSIRELFSPLPAGMAQTAATPDTSMRVEEI
jgi:flavin-dependent dehydrogenase